MKVEKLNEVDFRYEFPSGYGLISLNVAILMAANKTCLHDTIKLVFISLYINKTSIIL